MVRHTVALQGTADCTLDQEVAAVGIALDMEHPSLQQDKFNSNKNVLHYNMNNDENT